MSRLVSGIVSVLVILPETVGALTGSSGLVEEALVAESAKPSGKTRLKFPGGVSVIASDEPAAMVPEPTTALLLGLGLSALSAAHWLPGRS